MNTNLNASTITFSQAAISHLLSALNTQKNSLGIRLSVKKTGCSGLSYVVDSTENTLEGDIIFPLQEKYMVYIDTNSYKYIKGMHVDYIRQGLNHKFIFNNPNQTGQCGCGESFSV